MELIKENQPEINHLAEKAKVNSLAPRANFIERLEANSLEQNGVALLRAAVAIVYGVEFVAFFDFLLAKANVL